eukprot:scaffold867_cov317-Prasinococcus_capsulatus_cf.AAC.4
MLTALPRGRQVTEPSDGPEFQKPLFGFVENAERFNSRASMIGIVAIVLVEAVRLLPCVSLRARPAVNNIRRRRPAVLHPPHQLTPHAALVCARADRGQRAAGSAGLRGGQRPGLRALGAAHSARERRKAGRGELFVCVCNTTHAPRRRRPRPRRSVAPVRAHAAIRQRASASERRARWRRRDATQRNARVAAAALVHDSRQAHSLTRPLARSLACLLACAALVALLLRRRRRAALVQPEHDAVRRAHRRHLHPQCAGEARARERRRRRRAAARR